MWDTKNGHLLLVFHMPEEKSVKLAIQMNKEGAEVVSGFYVSTASIQAGTKGGEYQYLTE
ncbi:hypothetical protein [Bergeriella denitrificans]|uniref:hypothetical protein n=1 Tax=Bergeriella denitrificans TaxID=494 RepID=UPI0011C05369|nr:hypothetical protein [Bergeriella denitrificans]